MDKSKIKKVVLAYSGGLDTSIIIPWLKENYNNCEVSQLAVTLVRLTSLRVLKKRLLKQVLPSATLRT